MREVATPVLTALAGALLGAQVARLQSGERWEGAPGLRLTSPGLSLSLAAPFGRGAPPSIPPPDPTR